MIEIINKSCRSTYLGHGLHNEERVLISYDEHDISVERVKDGRIVVTFACDETCRNYKWTQKFCGGN